jgi:hypothetical protein
MGKGSVPIEGIGTAVFEIADSCGGNTLELKETLYVPEFNFNLLSVSRLAKAKIFVQSHEKGCNGVMNGEVIFSAQEREGLYILELVKSKEEEDEENNYAAMITKAEVEGDDQTVKAVALRSAVDWHARLGHWHDEGIKKIPVLSSQVKGKSSEKCDVCIIGKATKKGFPKQSERVTTQILELVHSDLMGKCVKSVGGSEYVLTFVDDFSRHLTIYFLKKKSEVFQKFKEYKAMVENNKSGYKIMALQTDGGGEYISKEFDDFLRSNGISRRKTVKYSPQQNGVAERVNLILGNGVRCMLIESGLPVTFWAEAMNYMCHIKNLCPSRSINFDIPLSLWENREMKPSDYEKLKPFGCKAALYIDNNKGGKFAPRAVEAVFVGTTEGVKGWKLWIPSERKFTTAHCVTFKEDCFPYIERVREEKEEFLPNLKMDNESEQEKEKVVTEEEFFGKDISQSSEEEFKSIISEEVEDFMEELMFEVEEDELCEEDIPLVNPDENEVNSVEQGSVGLRRSSRISKPINCKMCANCQLAMFIKRCDCEELKEPTTVEQALTSEHSAEWQKAMEDEMKQLKLKNVYEVVMRPKNVPVLSLKWVFKIKQDQNGKIERYKARIVARGFAQIKGVNFDKTFSPVVKKRTVRVLCAIAVLKGWEIHHLDVLTAYLNSPLEEIIYVEEPEHFKSEKENIVWKLTKTLYGLKQSAREWHKMMDKILTDLGLVKSLKDRCVYVQKSGDLIVFVYVDDIGVLGEKKQVELLKENLQKKLDLRDLKSMTNFLGMRVTQSDTSIALDQSKAIQDIIVEFKYQNANPRAAPLMLNCDDKTETSQKDFDKERYQSAVGKLMYISTCTRPDICHACSVVSQFNSQPKYKNWNDVTHVVRYLKGTANLKLTYDMYQPVMEIYCDADFNKEKRERLSRSGYIVKMAGGAVSWYSKKQSVTALSTAESEYYAMSEVVKEVLWLRMFLKELKLHDWVKNATVIKCDNQSAMMFAENGLDSENSKHIDIRYCFVEQCVERGEIEFQYVKSAENIADLFTKVLSGIKTEYFVEKLGFSM